MAKIQARHKKTGYLTLYVPKAEERKLNLEPGDEVEVHLTLIKRKKEV